MADHPLAQRLTQSAWQYFAAGNVASAVRHARDAFNLAPRQAKASAALGYFLIQSGELQEAAAVLLPALELAPNDALLHWYKGYLLQRGGNTAGAAAAFEQACRLDASLDGAAYALAWVLVDLGRIEDAAQWAAHALHRARTPQRLMQAGWIQQLRGQIAHAAQAYREAIDGYDPQATEQLRLHLHLAQCLRRLGQLTEVKALLHKALNIWPHDADLLAESSWLTHAQGDTAKALKQARAAVKEQPHNAQAWHRLGVFLQDSGDLRAADDALAKAQECDPKLTDALLRRAQIQRELKQYEGAKWLLSQVLHQSPDDAAAHALMVQVLLDLQDPTAASWLLCKSLRVQPNAPDLWRLLSVAQQHRGRRTAAARSLRRALRLNPHNLEALRMQCWQALGDGDVAQAIGITRQLVSRLGSDWAAQIQAAMVFAHAGLLPEAQLWAEKAVTQAPARAEAWLALSHVRLQQRQVADAELAVRQALRLKPAHADSLRHLGWLLMSSARHGQSQLAFLRAIECQPGDAVPRLELAEARRRAGYFEQSLQDANTLLAERPTWQPALLLKARVMTEGSMDGAVQSCATLMRQDNRSVEAVKTTLRLTGLGDQQARCLLPLLPVEILRTAWRAAVVDANHTQSQTCLNLLTHIACEDFEPDFWMATAALYTASLAATSTAAGLQLQARNWYRGLKLRSGLTPFPASGIPANERIADSRPRIAYIVTQQHQSLLRRVLAAHADDKAQIFVYTNQPFVDLPQHVHVQPLVLETLADSCAVNRIDVVIDTGGLHPFEGQFELLELYARRLAPVQLGWLGCWGSAGGLFDGLLADEVTVPLADTALYDETIHRLDGGQWCWDPPLAAPEPHLPPALRRGSVTYGVCARSLKLGEACMGVFAGILAATPNSAIRFIGAVADDWPLRRDILLRMNSQGVDASRVFFDPFQPHAAYLAWFARVDVLLDTFPGSGGLSLLDPLWLGVPVVTLAGQWTGARQGASILHSIGLSQWVAETEDGFCAVAVALASDRAALLEHHKTLRSRIGSSPLVDGRRMASQIAQLCLRLKTNSAATAAAPDAKARTKAHAQCSLKDWLATPRQITFPALASSKPPDLSVVVVLFNQAGLSRRTLQALADQRGVQFETIVIDNASDDNTAELLDTLNGATVICNADNIGFVRAARQGAATVTGRYIVFLNSDAILQEGALAASLQTMQANPNIGALGGRVVLTDGGLQEAGNVIFNNGSAAGIGRAEDPFSHAARSSRTTDYVSGVYLVTPASVWRMLGGFDETFVPAYYEDTDYCLRVWQAGLRVVYEPTVLLEHLEWGSATGNSAMVLMERNRELFCQRHQDWLQGQPAPQAQPLDADRWQSPEDRPQRRPRILFIDNEVPHMFKGGGLPRARLMLQALTDWPVTLYPLWTIHDDWRAVYASLPQSLEVALGHGLDGLEAFLESRQHVYDVLVVSRPPNLKALQPLRQRRPDLFTGMRLVYDAEALFALRENGMAEVQGRPLSLAAAHDRISAELALAADASDVLVVSTGDAQYFEDAGHRTHILSHSMAVRKSAPGAAGRQGLLFVGALHPGTPNEDGLLWFIQEVMPLLRQQPNPPVLSIVGVCQSAKVAAMAGADIKILGAQETLEFHYDAARVFVAPVRFAGGVPAKVIETVCNGLPTVASALLVQQLGWRDGQDILGAQDAPAFAAAIASLISDDAVWQRQQQAGWEQCVQRYDPDMFARTLHGVLSQPPVPCA